MVPFATKSNPNTPTPFNMSIPNGHFFDGLIVYGSLEKGSFAAKGFRATPPSLRSASVREKNDYHERLRSLLQSIGEREALQIQWSCNSDYRRELIQYKEDTEKCSNTRIRRIRNEKFTHFWTQMENRELRREELILFPSLAIESYSGNLRTRKSLFFYYEKTIEQLKTFFQELEGVFRNILGPDTTLEPMDNLEHFLYFKKFLNPSLEARSSYSAKDNFDPALSIQENCAHGEWVGLKDGGLYFDGYHQTMLSLERWPSRTAFGIIFQLTGLPFLDYRITLNISPLPADKEMRREERKLEKLQGEYSSNSNMRSLATAIDKKVTKIDALAGGYIFPFEAEVLIRVWDSSKEGLQSKANAIKQAINTMSGAQHFECALATTAKKMFFNSWPGNRSHQYKHRRLYAEALYPMIFSCN